MASWFHAAILGTALAATAAVGFASAAMLANTGTEIAKKGDRLVAMTADGTVDQYQTFETRSDGVSVLTSVRVN